jgi:hypothetical protein
MRSQYFWGLGLGFIPLVLFLIGYGLALGPGSTSSSFPISLIFIGLGLYILELIATIILLFVPAQRFVGYGLLTAFLVSAVVAGIACTVLPGLLHSA